jgi:hypothetical protein
MGIAEIGLFWQIGPASYSDEALHKVHAGLNIDRTSFEEMGKLLRETLEDFDIERSDVDQIMHEIDSRADIIISRHDS